MIAMIVSQHPFCWFVIEDTVQFSCVHDQGSDSGTQVLLENMQFTGTVNQEHQYLNNKIKEEWEVGEEGAGGENERKSPLVRDMGRSNGCRQREKKVIQAFFMS